MMTAIGYVCVFMTALMSLSACGGAREVRWSTALMLRALPAIDQELAAPFEAPIEVVGGSGRKATVRDCHSALDLLGRGFEAPRDVEQRVLRAASIRCLALRTLKSATPARRSALDTFHLSDDALAVLPPTLAAAASDEARRRVREAEGQGKSWRDFVPNATAKTEPASDDRPDPGLVVESPGWRVRVTTYAYGDFDGDGSEDLMLRVDEEAVGGTYRHHRLVIVAWDPGRRAFRTVREVLP